MEQVLRDGGERLSILEAFRHRMLDDIIGQKLAIDHIVMSLGHIIAGMQDPESPLLTLLLAGPTGVGKTETMRVLAKALFGNIRAFTRINCQEYIAHYNISKLLGSPPGYVGGEIRPLLSQENLDKHHLAALENRSGLLGSRSIPIFQNPTESGDCLSLVLFDEVEKADPRVWNLFLGILEDGTLTLANNEEVSFRNSIVVCTTNVGSNAMQAYITNRGSVKPIVADFFEEEGYDCLDQALACVARKAIEATFPPEFINRFDEIINYQVLKETDILQICDIGIKDILNRTLRCSSPFAFRVTPQAKEWLVKRGYSNRYGARELKRVLRRYLLNPLVHLVCSKQIQAGDIVDVLIQNDRIVFSRGEHFEPSEIVEWAKVNGLLSSYRDRLSVINRDGGAKEEIKERGELKAEARGGV